MAVDQLLENKLQIKKDRHNRKQEVIKERRVLA